MAKATDRFDPDHSQERAREARDNVARIEDPERKRLMLEIAGTYDQLAKKADEVRAR
jgi:hypothetical protein